MPSSHRRSVGLGTKLSSEFAEVGAALK